MQRLAITVLCSFIAGAAVAKYYWPTIQQRTEIKEKEVVRNDVHVITRTVERPDGTRETITESTDKSTQRSTKQLNQQINKQNQWFLALSATTHLSELRPVYGAQASRRILGPFYLGAMGNTNGEFGLLIGVEL